MPQCGSSSQVYLFRSLSPEECARVVGAAVEADFDPGTFIYQQGEEGNAFYVLLDGRVELLFPGVVAGSVYGRIGPGGHFGDVALLTGKVRCMSVRTLTRCRLLIFDREAFEAVLLAHPVIHRALAHSLAERLRRLTSVEDDSERTQLRQRQTMEFLGTDPLPQATTTPRETEGNVPSGLQGDVQFARKIRSRIRELATTVGPVLISGEYGTGRRLVAQQIHLHGANKGAPYLELDIRDHDPWFLEGKLFGHAQDTFPFSEGRQLGIFEQISGGTLVLHHAEELPLVIQNRLQQAVVTGCFTNVDGHEQEPFQARLILVSDLPLERLETEESFTRDFVALFVARDFTLPPLREHRKDIPNLVEYYLRQYGQEYGKKIERISPDALGLLMRYDWPGNLTELASVLQRAIIVTKHREIISEQILLGLPRAEGKFVYNLLRLPRVRRILESQHFPILPKIIITTLFALGIATLLLGPEEAERNLGITMSWYLGWPLLMVSFFFLPRLWCSVCALSAPGKFLQRLLNPERKVPDWIVRYSGWILALLCLNMFWVEIVWNAYENTRLTAGIMLSIAFGALVCGAIFKRYAWCRYLCPLGALNAIFSMPSILELRANRQLCDNKCLEHACFTGNNKNSGCPMFRHPFLVDNNKDCILCGVCVKNCLHRSIQINLRLAPRELWDIEEPRIADSFLIVTLAAVYFLLARHDEFLSLVHGQTFSLLGQHLAPALAGTLIFWGLVALFWGGYCLTTRLQSLVRRKDFTTTLAACGYGLIPLVLAGFLAVNLRLFLAGVGRLTSWFSSFAGADAGLLLSPAGKSAFLHLIIVGGWLASLYAMGKIVYRLEGFRYSLRANILPLGYVFLLGVLFLRAL